MLIVRACLSGWGHTECVARAISCWLHKGSVHASPHGHTLHARHPLAHMHYMLRVCYRPNHSGHTPRAQHTVRCLHQRPMPAVPYPDTPPHTTQSGTGYTDKLFTSCYNFGPSVPWKGGWAKGPGPACTPTSSGADPSPSSAGSQGHSIRPAGVEVEMGEQGRACEATVGWAEAGAWGWGPGPRKSGSMRASQASEQATGIAHTVG